MNTNKNISDKQLENLFKQINLDSPSSDFMENLMKKVELESKRQALKQQWIPYLQMAAGILAIVLIPGLYFYFFAPDFFSSFSIPHIHLKFDSNITLIGFTVLFLLVADSLLRHHYFSKRK